MLNLSSISNQLTGSLLIDNKHSRCAVMQTLLSELLLLSQSQLQLLSDAFTDTGLSVVEEYSDYYSHEVLVLMVLTLSELSNQCEDVSWFEQTLSSVIDKHESIETLEWESFVPEFLKVIERGKDERYSRRYWVVETSLVHGYSKSIHTQLAISKNQSVQYLPAQVAQELNQGNYNDTLYLNPCFDADGLLTIPHDLKEIDVNTFELLSQYMSSKPFHYTEGLDDIPDEVIEFTAAKVNQKAI